MALGPRRSHHSSCHCLRGIHHLRTGTDRQSRYSKVAHLEKEAMGVEHRLDGTGAFTCDCVHDHPGHETIIWKAPP